MRTVFLVGGTASGKSCVGRVFERLGAERIDLDDVSREVLDREGACLAELVEEFGPEVVGGDALFDDEEDRWVPMDGAWAVDRAALAHIAFATPEGAAALEAIEMPYIRARLADRLTVVSCASVRPRTCVVEVPLLDRVEDLLPLADDVVWVRTDKDRRRSFAQSRGMDADDFDARVTGQPADAYLERHATSVIDNDGDLDALADKARAWWREHGLEGGSSRGCS
ncbi:dephospho-CoA kinase [Atopobiaceae bacterium 24-176]